MAEDDDSEESSTLPYPGTVLNVASSQKGQGRESPSSRRQRVQDEVDDRLAEEEMFDAPLPAQPADQSSSLTFATASSPVQLQTGCHFQADSTSRMNKNSTLTPKMLQELAVPEVPTVHSVTVMLDGMRKMKWQAPDVSAPTSRKANTSLINACPEPVSKCRRLSSK